MLKLLKGQTENSTRGCFPPYESRFRGGILLLGFLLCPTAQRKSQTSMKILISGFNVCANAHGSSREDIFLQLIERFKGGNNINKGNTARKKVLITVTLIIDKLEEIAIHKTGDLHAWI